MKNLEHKINLLDVAKYMMDRGEIKLNAYIKIYSFCREFGDDLNKQAEKFLSVIA